MEGGLLRHLDRGVGADRHELRQHAGPNTYACARTRAHGSTRAYTHTREHTGVHAPTGAHGRQARLEGSVTVHGTKYIHVHTYMCTREHMGVHAPTGAHKRQARLEGWVPNTRGAPCPVSVGKPSRGHRALSIITAVWVSPVIPKQNVVNHSRCRCFNFSLFLSPHLPVARQQG